MAPVAFAGAIIPGLARFIVMLSAHADVFGVGITAVDGSILVVPSCATTGCIVPGDTPGICGVDSGRSAPLLSAPPGVELHTVVEELPIGVIGPMFPVVVIAIGDGIVPNGEGVAIAAAGVIVDDVVVVPGIDVEIDGAVDNVGTGTAVKGGDGRGGIAGGCGAGMVESGKKLVDDVAGCWENVNGAIKLPFVGVKVLGGGAETVGAAETEGIILTVLTIADMEATGTGAVAGAICPVGVEQITTVPGVVGLEASGTGASVVSGVPGWVAAENGLGPLSGEVTIAPGVDGRPIAVVPMVETCARLASHPASSVTATNIKRRIASSAPISLWASFVS